MSIYGLNIKADWARMIALVKKSKGGDTTTRTEIETAGSRKYLYLVKYIS